MRRSVVLLLAVSGCALSTDRLRLSVARADRVELQSVAMRSGALPEYDLEHPTTLLAPGARPETVAAPFRAGFVPARRNADGSIDLIVGRDVWPIVRADGSVTWLRDEAYRLDASGTTWAFLATPPGVHARTPWQLRIATPRANVRDARIRVRREPVLGSLFLAFGLGAGAAASGLLYAADHSQQSDGAAIPLALGIADLVVAALSIGYGLYALLVPPHDEVLVQ